MTKVTFKKDHQTINIKNAIAYDMVLRGEEGSINIGLIILMVFVFFPLAVILVLINICKAKTPIYHITVYQADHSVEKKVIRGEIQYKIAMEMLEKYNVPRMEVL
jgi:hypothetical protein